MAALSINLDNEVHPSKRAQIAYFKVDEVSVKILSKYADFVDVFLRKLAIRFPKHTRIHDHAIKLVDNQYPIYGLIYTLGLVELETLKIYIKNNLVSGLIRSFKSPAEAPIFFEKKPDKSFWLCIGYRGFNNLRIKNCDLLHLVEQSLNWLD